jgi:membrane-associated phospholipid phosphatase
MAEAHLDHVRNTTIEPSSDPLTGWIAPSPGIDRSSSTGAADGSGSAYWPTLRRSWPLRWGDVGLFVAGYIALTALFAGMGKLVTGALDGSLGELDRDIATSFEESRTPTMNDVSYWGSMMSETAVKIVLTGVVAAVMIAVWRRWNDALLVALALILEACIFLTVTLLVGRARPDVVRLDSSPVDSSFPSGHVAAAVVYGAFVLIVARHTTKRWPVIAAFCIAAAVSVIVAWARMYRGMHHLSDVVAGVMLGLLSLWVTWLVMRRAEQRNAEQRNADQRNAERRNRVDVP